MHHSPHFAVEEEGVKTARRVAPPMSLSCLFGLAFVSGEWKHGTAALFGMNGALAESTHFSQRNDLHIRDMSCTGTHNPPSMWNRAETLQCCNMACTADTLSHKCTFITSTCVMNHGNVTLI